MEDPTTQHMAAVKQILRCIHDTLDLGYHLGRKEKCTPMLIGYSDSDLAGDVNDKKSTHEFSSSLDQVWSLGFTLAKLNISLPPLPHAKVYGSIVC